MYRLPNLLLATSAFIIAMSIASYLSVEVQDKLDDMAWKNRSRNAEFNEEVANASEN